MELAVGLRNRQIVDAGVATLHEPEHVELPILVAVRAIPLAGVVSPLVSKAHRDAVIGEGPKFLDQSIVELAAPLAGQELDDLLAADREFGAIAPVAVDGISERHTLWVAAVPGVLGQADFLNCSLACERWKRRTLFAHKISVQLFTRCRARDGHSSRARCRGTSNVVVRAPDPRAPNLDGPARRPGRSSRRSCNCPRYS